MGLDVYTKKVTKNAYRITNKRGKTALRIRVPGGHLKSEYLNLVNDIATKYGNGTVHITIRQGFEVPGIPYEKISEVNKMIEPLIKGVEIESGVKIEDTEAGYPAAGTRNISACIGNKVCQFANFDTTAFAKKLESQIFPDDYHVKTAITGCPNDCIKGHMQDIGIIGMAEPQLDYDACIGCEACVKNCRQRVTEALKLENYKVVRDERRCIGCGECVLKCPTQAWTRNPTKYYKLVIMGRTGKTNPRIARPFLEWIEEDTIIKIFHNLYKYIDKHINKKLKKEHVGYIVDRTGYPIFKKEILEGIELNPKAKVAKHINFGGYKYVEDSNMKR